MCPLSLSYYRNLLLPYFFEIRNAVFNKVTTRELTEAIGSVLDVPAKSLSHDGIAARPNPFLARLLATESQASRAKARDLLGWEPKELGILQDIETGSYLAVAAGLKKSMA